MMSKDPEKTAQFVRNMFGIDGVPAPDLWQLVAHRLGEQIPNSRVQIVQGCETPGDEARVYPSERTLKVTTGLVRRLERSDPHARFILAHELGHLVMGHREQAAFSGFGAGNRYTAVESAEEHEANSFAVEFLVPHLLVLPEENVEQVAERFCVTHGIAKRALRRVERSSAGPTASEIGNVERMRREFRAAQERAKRNRRRRPPEDDPA